MAVLLDDAVSEHLLLGAALVSAYPFTMACWYKSDDTGTTTTIMSMASSASSQGRHRINYSGIGANPILILSNANSAQSTAGSTAGAWNHACGVWASATSRTIYLNGGNSANNASNTAIGTNNQTGIGFVASSAPGGYFSGSLAEAAFWSIDLIAGEVAALAAGVSPMMIRPANLLAYWPLYTPTHVSNVWTTGVTRNMAVQNGPIAQADHPPVPTLRFGLRGRIYAPYVVSGAHTVTVNQTSETDTSQALTRLKTLAFAQSLESDAAQVASAIRVYAIAQTNETDLAQATTWNPMHRLVGQATSTELAQAISQVITVTVDQAFETDTAQAVANAPLTRLINQASEADSATVVTVTGGEAALAAGTVPIRYVTEGPNVVPVQTLGAGGIDIVPCRVFVGPANVVPVYEAGDTKNNRVKVVLV